MRTRHYDRCVIFCVLNVDENIGACLMDEITRLMISDPTLTSVPLKSCFRRGKESLPPPTLCTAGRDCIGADLGVRRSRIWVIISVVR